MKKTDLQYCRTCDMTVPAVRQAPNHVLHIILSLLTAGLWLFVYLFVALSSGSKRWQCQRCGNWTDATPRTVGDRPGFGRVAVGVALTALVVAAVVAATA